MNSRKLALAGVLLVLAACADEPAGFLASTAVQQAAAHIDGERMRAHIVEISADDYQGRAPGTEGDRKTRDYLVARLQALGLQPGAAGGDWVQAFNLVGLHTAAPQAWTFRGPAGREVFRWREDFMLNAGRQAQQVSVADAPLIFVGYGIQAPEYNWDDFKGVDVSGKVLLMLNNDPHTSADLFEGETRLYYGRWTYKYEMAARLGAAGAIIIHTDYSAGYPWQVLQTSNAGMQFELPNEGEPTIELKAWMTEDASKRLLALAGADLQALTAAAQQRDFQPVALDLTTSLEAQVTREQTGTANVLGLLPGSDASLADEVVIYTAHHDHLGVAEAGGDTAGAQDLIYNGAMDNGTGVAGVLAIARAFSQLQPAPRRSVLFAFVGAEEQGLLGSAYYARHPTFAPGRIAANINLDGGQIAGRSRDISYIGYGRSSLDAVAEQAAAAQGRVVKGDSLPSAGFFYRSDHFSLARIGVPSIYYRGGVDLRDGGLARGRELAADYITRHYHQPSDEITSAWRFDGLVEDARFGFYAGLLIAAADSLPDWREGDEFAAARQAALDALQNNSR